MPTTPTRAVGVVVSGYDAADRLLADDSRSWNDRRYSYDAADNRTSATSRTAKQTIVPNALNQMQTVNGQPTQYDAAGNLLEDEARQYDWDAEHRLIRIRYKAQAGKETRFGYDGLGRRTVITEVDGTGTTETHYIWCGEAICQKRDANGQLLRAYYPEGESGPEIGKRVAKADTGTETDADGDEHDGRDQDGDDGKSAPQTESIGSLIYARNHLGSVTDTLTPDGRAVTHTEYGPYGELLKSQGRAEYRSDFGYAGMQYHAASGMYLTLFRAYDPGTGRWVSRDPIGERGGINLYGYVAGNPLKYTDRTGLVAGVDDAAEGAVVACLANPACDAALAEVGAEAMAAAEVAEAAAIEAAEAAEQACSTLSKQAVKGIRSYLKRIAEHKQKLSDFIENPTVRPGMERLPQEAVEAQQAARINHLLTEIQTFGQNIVKLIKGN
ncbi:RHS repeat-associated core domain-containing protein [Ralstonia solanacearum]|uniref:RHS repeat-associated core domain-containing protein n=2 Tax=Ralstonia solanacearum TaxID=305 RepID=UPI0020A2E733|nr:RHS repeat-associated core domain-containing protein [Ralstonia solanacearum]